MDIGFHSAGFSTVVAIEQDHSCCNTLRLNMPGVPIIEADIRRISTETILKAARAKPLEIDLVIGGPPCQSFSMAGLREGLNDPRGLLPFEFLRVVREALPKAFVMENVKGMANWGKGEAIRAIVEEAGRPILFEGNEYRYDVSFQVLNAVDYGVPQSRERIFIVGNRLGKKFEFPKPTHGGSAPGLKPWTTVGEAIFPLPIASPPSAIARRVSATIKGRRDASKQP